MNTSLPNGQWYALCTRSKCEKKVVHLLAKKKFDAYLPLRTITSSWSFLKKTEQEPLFPGIVFVRSYPTQLSKFTAINGVCGVLHWLNAPAVVWDQDICMIRSFLAEHSQVRVVRTAVHIEPHLAEDEPDFKVARMLNTVSQRLSSLGFMLVADLPATPRVPETTFPQLFPFYRYTDAG